jgi:hypothetical protein
MEEKYKKPDHIKEAEQGTTHSVYRSEMRGTAQCQEHSWRKESDNEIACTKCPTVHTVADINEYIK